MMRLPVSDMIQKPAGRLRLASAARIEPLVDEAEGEYDLSGRTVDEHPQRYVIVAEETGDGCLRVMSHGYDKSERQQIEQSARHQWQAVPCALDVEVPDIDVVGDHLADDYGEVVAQPSVEA